jgi:membrane-bound lytic murein transglycosylase F
MPVRTVGAAIAWCVLVAASGCPAPPPPVVSPVLRDEVLVVEKAATPPPLGLPPPLVDLGDLAAIKGRGTLRILVYGRGEDMLPRAGASMNASEETAVLIAHHLGLEPERIRVERFADLIPMLLEGKGDMVAARMSVTAARRGQVAFSRPVSSVDELLIVSKKARLPTTLKGFTPPITVRASSAYRETLDEQKAKVEPALVLADADEGKDTITLLHDVAAGTIAATVAIATIITAASAAH